MLNPLLLEFAFDASGVSEVGGSGSGAAPLTLPRSASSSTVSFKNIVPPGAVVLALTGFGVLLIVGRRRSAGLR